MCQKTNTKCKCSPYKIYASIVIVALSWYVWIYMQVNDIGWLHWHHKKSNETELDYKPLLSEVIDPAACKDLNPEGVNLKIFDFMDKQYPIEIDHMSFDNQIQRVNGYKDDFKYLYCKQNYEKNYQRCAEKFKKYKDFRDEIKYNHYGKMTKNETIKAQLLENHEKAKYQCKKSCDKLSIRNE